MKMNHLISAEKLVSNAVALAKKQSERGRPPIATKVMIKIDRGLAKRIDRLERLVAKLIDK